MLKLNTLASGCKPRLRSVQRAGSVVPRCPHHTLPAVQISQMRIQEATTVADIAACYPVMKQLRQEQPWMASVDVFTSKVQRMQRQHGFVLVYLEGSDAVRAVAGYTVSEALWQGKEMFIADLVTESDSRKQGYGGILLGWLKQKAAEEGCGAVWLCSGAARVDAHRFYEANGMGRFGYIFCCATHAE